MTKEDQLKQFGEELDPKYAGFVEGQDPPWSKERYKRALEVARKYDLDLIEEKRKLEQ